METEASNQHLDCGVRMSVKVPHLLQPVISTQEVCLVKHCCVPSQSSGPEALPKPDLAESLGGAQWEGVWQILR